MLEVIRWILRQTSLPGAVEPFYVISSSEIWKPMKLISRTSEYD